MIRQAEPRDLDAVEKIYLELHTYHETHTNYCNWDARIYPLRIDAERALANGFLYVYEENGEILGAEILNHLQPEEYEKLLWQVEAADGEVLVIHTLCVAPHARGKGIAKALIHFAEEHGRALGCRAMRFDTAETNIPAYTLYTSLGYTVVGKTLVQTGKNFLQMLYGFEKKLS